MPRLVTNESLIHTHIQILHLISSILHTIKLQIHYQSHYNQVDIKYIMGLKALYDDGMTTQ